MQVAGPLSEDAAPSEREREAERAMLGLRLTKGIAAADFSVPFDRAEAVLRQCAAHGLAAEKNGRWRLTPEGFLVSNGVILRVLDALGF